MANDDNQAQQANEDLTRQQQARQQEAGKKATDDGQATEAQAETTADAAAADAATKAFGDPAGAVEQLQAQLAQAQEEALRAQAEAQNARRRAELDVEKAHKFALERFVGDLLPVVDNLERALAAIDVDAEGMSAVTEGVELTLKSFLDTLKRHNVEQINPEGEPFNPQVHQAMTAVESADVEPNTVINVFQKGYLLHGRLVRPAMVVVSKAPVEA